ncbi:hypothetical protein [Noviherbaspirillum saxi]|uniref:Uncharacterized protein n=1 Tax=Noviherbaspirillum saxi TaxID=2320863 RepID=A0A3A3FR03_9BURK|nr:hypothetical protein [Noviherbaspirillum saxi]RJF97654.1 hypothetical protein D3871_03285 [Noviherbaspirillum saxi]
MSEYQYYEFVAIDRPLTRNEMAELRSRSSRATITATSFVNEYNWGDLKADPADWMRSYFDAFVYTANWCSCRLSLRLPHEAFDEAELKRFATQYALMIDNSGAHWIISWSLDEGQDYDRFGMETGQGWMGRLMPLRDELLRGDLRPLYLGWLAGVSAGEVTNNAVEPDVPPGMAQLSAAQQALVEFLEIDPDLMVAATAGSQKIEDYWHDDDSVEVWVAELRRNEIETVFNLLLQGASHQAERRVKSEFLAWLKESGSRESSSAKPHKVAELRALAEEAKTLRLKREEEEHVRQEAERRKQREAYLLTLAADFDRHWKAIDDHAERGTASGYDEAKRAIVDLADAYALASDRNAFDQALRRFMVRHAKRGALVRRLVEAGLWEK